MRAHLFHGFEVKMERTMPGIVNGGQNCYFSSLIQCILNSTTVCSKVQKHADAVAQDPSECQPIFLQTKQNNQQLNSATIFTMTLYVFVNPLFLQATSHAYVVKW